MGAVTDYFRPASGSTFCEMLTAGDKHQWSYDATDASIVGGTANWITPSYWTLSYGQNPVTHWGGSESSGSPQDAYMNANGDNRHYLSYWGGCNTGCYGGNGGGCCADHYNDEPHGWQKAFDMYVFGASSGAQGDPHLTFAHGGHADFRGSHRASYVFLSSPGYQFAPFFQEVDFWYSPAPNPTASQLVHGTFMTRALWRVRTPAGRELLITTEAMTPGEASVLTLPDTAISLEPGEIESEIAKMETVNMKPWQVRVQDELRIETRMLSVTVATPAWNVTITSKHIYGLLQPLLNETHVHGKWEEDQRRLDLQIHGAYPQPDAHGIIGQSYRNETRRDGKLDEYAADVAVRSPQLAGARRVLLPMTTSAQAEGAIEGVYTDYKLADPLTTRFKYTRYDRVAQTSSATGRHQRTSSASDWEDLTTRPATKREL